jgi:hypothetical protein
VPELRFLFAEYGSQIEKQPVVFDARNYWRIVRAECALGIVPAARLAPPGSRRLVRAT